jgi:trk system potassium uptake protein TrkH
MQASGQARVGLLRMTSRPIGALLLVLALALTACAGLGHLALPEHGWDAQDTATGARHLLLSAGITAVAGGFGLLLSWGVSFKMGRREALFVVSMVWLSLGIFGAIPFVIGAGMSIPDALFEAFSGVTTTGGTILTEIEGSLSAPLHLWRMAAQWLGGLGIVVLFVALFPEMGVGGKRLFQGEAAGPTTAGLSPRIRDTARNLLWIYLSITAVAMVTLRVCGLPWFDALATSLSTLGTGGFAIKNGSIGEYNSLSVNVVVTGFMLMAGTNFSLFHRARTEGMSVFWRNPEFRLYGLLFLGISAVIALDLSTSGLADSAGDAVTYSTFQVAAIMTGTGFGTADFEQWSTVSKMLLVTLYFTGGCAGSTSGGMKLMRLLIIFKVIAHEMRLAFRPSLVAPVRVGDQVVPDGVVRGTMAYALLFLATVGLTAIVVSVLDPVDMTTAFMAALACVANVGPGLGAVGPTDNYAFFSDASKMVLSGAMLLGRLEFFSLLALFVPGFWRR